ncbi:hypothetical protein [Nocardiopsis halotolerans]|uniref:hypothetical protein n=1 Tax=Nocardiopsis halotolerans TaxID=124252 RepID=UPI00034ACE04|nr:hypothetical protein [Nocardiopsis halotolerans]
MTEEPYDVDTDMGDDPELSKAVARERRIEADYDIQEYDFPDPETQGTDSSGPRGIDEGVRSERSDLYPRESWGGETRSAEEEALHEEDDSVTPDVDQGIAARDEHPDRPYAHPADTPHGDREDERDRTTDETGYVPDAEDPRDTGAPDVPTSGSGHVRDDEEPGETEARDI